MLRLQNYYEHPSQNRYMVYEFHQEEAAIYFEQKLIAADVPYEKGEETRNERNFTLFGIHKKYSHKVTPINTDTIIKHKAPFIPDKGLMWFTFILTVGVLALAFIGYLKSLG